MLFDFIIISRLAIKYIKHLQYLLSFAPNAKIPPHIVEFDAASPAWFKNPSVPGAKLTALEIEALESGSGALYTLPQTLADGEEEEHAGSMWVASALPTAQQQRQQQQSPETEQEAYGSY